MTDRAFLKSFTAMIAALAALAVVLYILANAIGGKAKPEKAATNSAAIAERIKPVGEVTIASAVINAVVPAANAADKGEQVYKQSCVACHAAGVAGAPKFGDKAAWAPRIAKGEAAMWQIVLKGKGAMPPRGTFAGPEADLKAAMNYMVSKAK